MPLTKQAEIVLTKRYLLPDETPDQLFRRVARHVASQEKDSETWEAVFYNLLSSLTFLPNSPCLANAGKPNGQLSACYVLPVDDSIESIFEAIKNAALIHQAGGGTGFSFSRIRPKGSLVASTGHVASGPVSFMSVFDAATDSIKQGGMRRGANMGILRVDHPDILEFITCKDSGQKITNFNISVAITDAFMTALEHDEKYVLKDPYTGRYTAAVSAKDVWDKICTSAHKTGDPGIIFIDGINRSRANPIDGWDIEATNPSMPSDVLVSTRGGVFPIAALEGQTFQVRSMDGTWAPAYCRKSSSSAEVFRIDLGGGRVTYATASHKWPVQTVSRHRKCTVKTATSELCPGDLLPLPRNEPLGIPSSGLSEDDGFFCGYLLGDGWITTRSDGSRALGLGFFGDKTALADRILAYVNSGKTSVSSLKPADDGGTYIQITNQGFIDSVVTRFGYDVTKDHLPSGVWSGGDPFIHGFVDGFLSADGCITGQRLILTTSRQALADEFAKLLSLHGILTSVRTTVLPSVTFPNGKSYDRSYLRVDVQISPHQFRSVFTLSHPRKLASLLGLRDPKRNQRCVSVRSVTSIGTLPVWDIAVNHAQHVFPSQWVYTGNCGEQPLYPYDVCTLGSINLGKFVVDADKPYIDYGALATTVAHAVRFLDNTIDVNHYPLDQIALQARTIRRIGLGVMGWHDALLLLGIPYASDAAVESAERVMKYINFHAALESSRLATERGVFPIFDQARQDLFPVPQRNCAVTTIAPTGTISLIAGCSSGIEPLFALEYEHAGLEGGLKGEKIVSEAYMTAHKRWGDRVPDLYLTATEIDPIWHLKHQAAFQSYTDNAVSKTINLPNSATVEDVSNIYKAAYQMDCKGVTVYRDGSRDGQVLSQPVVTTSRPQMLASSTIKQQTPFGNMYVTISEHDGAPYEVFAVIGKAGSDVQAMTEAACRTVSKYLQASPVGKRKEVLEEIAGQWEHIGGSSVNGFGSERTRSIPDALSRVLSRYCGAPEDTQYQKATGLLCQECGTGSIQHQGGCEVCVQCGASKC